LRLATVHVFSTHDFLVRYWLAACGIDPDRDVELSVIPPEMTAVALRAGQIDGFCAGAPWGAIAAEARVGRTVLATSEIWRNHPEKCLAVSRRWADSNPEPLDRMIDAVIDGARACDDPGNADDVAEILGRKRYLGMAPEIIRRSLPLAEDEAPAAGGARSTFFRNAANFPWRSHADWFLAQMVRWGHLPAGTYGDAAAEIYRPDLCRSAAERLGISAPVQDRKTEGAHATAWQLAGTLSPIPMDPDSFCDRRAFDG
jgi:ABC-type nitrate/sulfonate/bicarbonate transport system substrate-binding protein